MGLLQLPCRLLGDKRTTSCRHCPPAPLNRTPVSPCLSCSVPGKDFCPESISKSDAFSLLRSWDSLKHRWLPLSFLSSGTVSCRGHLVTRHLCDTLLSGYIEWSTWGKGTYFTPYFILLNPRTCGREEFSTPVVDSKNVSTTCPHCLPQLSLGASLWFVDILHSQSSP